MAKITNKTVKSKYPPKQTNVIWIDTSQKPAVIKSYIDGQWVVVGGGVTDYNDIKNKPTINGVELDGNKTSQDLGVYSKPSSGIPQSDLSSDVQSQLNKHFKGWYNTLAELKAEHTATDGDSAYVKDASPATTWSIYVYDSTASSDNYWADSGTNADTSNVQTFASGEGVNETYIDNTHLVNPKVGALPTAEDVMQLKAKLEGVTASEAKASYVAVDGYKVQGNGVLSSNSSAKYSTISLNGAKSVRFLGINLASSSTSSTKNTGYCFGHYDGEEIEANWVIDTYYAYEATATTSETKEYIAIPSTNSTHLRTNVKYSALTENAFYCYLSSGDTIGTYINEACNEIIANKLVDFNTELTEEELASYNLVYPLFEDDYDIETISLATKRKMNYSVKNDGSYGTSTTYKHVCQWVEDDDILCLNLTQNFNVAFVTGSNNKSGDPILLAQGEVVKSRRHCFLNVPSGANLILMYPPSNMISENDKLIVFHKKKNTILHKTATFNRFKGADSEGNGLYGIVARLEANKTYNVFMRNSGTATKTVLLINDLPATSEIFRTTTGNQDKKYTFTPQVNCYLQIAKNYDTGLVGTTIEEIVENLEFVDSMNDYRAKVTQEAALIGLTKINDTILQDEVTYKKAYQLAGLHWTPKSSFYGKTRSYVYEQGVEQTHGIPYSNNFTDYKYIPQTVSIHTFMTAVNNPYSVIYTERVKNGDSESIWGRTYYGPNGYAYYAAVCCSYTSAVGGYDGYIGNPLYILLSKYFGVTRATNIQGEYDLELLRIGDVLDNLEHSIIIIDLIRNESGELTSIKLAESAGGVYDTGACRISTVSVADFKSWMRVDGDDPFTIFRVTGYYKNTKYTPSEYVAVGDETPVQVTYNNDICTIYGDKPTLAEGYQVVLNYNLDGSHGNWTEIELYKDDTLINTYSISSIDQSALPESQRNHALDLGSELEAGNYKARMTDGINYSDYTYWEITSNDVSVVALGNGKYQITNNTGKRLVECVLGEYVSGDSLGMRRVSLLYPLTLENVDSNTFTLDLYGIVQIAGKSIYPNYVFKLVVKGDYTCGATAVIKFPDIDYTSGGGSGDDDDDPDDN